MNTTTAGAAMRLPYVDALKGLAITLVVVGHTLQHYFSDDELLVRLVYSFHIPLFMFLSGYCSYRLQSWQKIEQRFYQLIIPFFSAIFVSYMVYDFGRYSLMGLCGRVVDVLYQPDRGLWFLWVLFFINVIFLVCRKLAERLHIHEAIVVLMAIALLNVIELVTHFELFGYHWIAWYLIFFAMGVYWRTYLTIPPPRCRNRLIYNVILAICYVLFLPSVYFFKMHNEAPTFYRWVNLGGYFPILYRLLVAILGIGFCYGLFRQVLCRRWRRATLCKLGLVTLPVYYLHFYCLYFLYKVPFFESMPKLLAILLIVAAALLASYWLARLCKLSRMLRLLIFGENIFKIKKL